jgi:hypothetical protein
LLEVTKDELILAVAAEVERIFGEDPGFQGDAEQYRWLEATYGVTEGDDVKWQFLLYDNPYDPAETIDPLDPDDPKDADMVAFVEDDAAITAFLEGVARALPFRLGSVGSLAHHAAAHRRRRRSRSASREPSKPPGAADFNDGNR